MSAADRAEAPGALGHGGEPGYAPARLQRTVFGEDPELYDRLRPSYPAALIDDVVALVEAPSRAIDVGCGTGKATALLAARGVTGVAVDPDPRMTALAATRLAGYQDWRVDVSDFEHWTPSDGDVPFDLVVSAQAWHWIDPDVRVVKGMSLLRPGGWLALVWNRPAADASPLRQTLDSVYAELAPEVPTDGPGSTARCGPKELAEDAELAHATRRAYPWSHRYTAAEWTDLLRTQSDHRLLPPRRLEALLHAVAAAIDAHGGVYEHPLMSLLVTAQRRAVPTGDRVGGLRTSAIAAAPGDPGWTRTASPVPEE